MEIRNTETASVSFFAEALHIQHRENVNPKTEEENEENTHKLLYYIIHSFTYGEIVRCEKEEKSTCT